MAEGAVTGLSTDLHKVQTASGTHPASYLKGSGSASPGVKAAGM